MRVNPPGLITEQVEDEGSKPHPQGINRHKKESLENFNGVNVEAVVYGNFAEHKDDRKDMHRYIQEYGYWTQDNSPILGVLLDRRIKDGPVDDDYNHMKDKAAGIKELKEPQVVGGCSIGLASKVARSEPGDTESMPRMQAEIAAQQEGTNVSKEEEKLDGSFVRTVIESEDKGHGEIDGKEEA